MKFTAFLPLGVLKMRRHIAAHLRIWALVVLLLLLAMAEYLPEGIQILQGNSLLSFLHNMAGLLWMSFPFYLAVCAPVALLPPRGIRIYLAISLPVITSVAFLHIFLLSCFRVPFDRGLLYVLFDLSKEETLEYLSTHLRPWLVLVFSTLTAIALAFVTFPLCWHWKRETRSAILGALLAAPLLVSAARFILIGKPKAIVSRISCLRVAHGLASILFEQDHFYRAAVAAPQPPGEIHLLTPDFSNLLGIIAIGESATRSHHGLYGYSRDTTPFQSRCPDLVVFRQVCSAAPLTGVSLKYTLTFATLHQPEKYRCTLVSILKKAGIRTVWLSAQADRCTTDALLFHDADRVLFSPENSYDNAMTKMLPQAIAGWEHAPVVILLHLYGSHIDYSKRYPKEQAIFTDPPPDSERLNAAEIEAVNCYDNSIAFTDSILETLVHFLEQTNRPAFLLYFSDHGENATRNGRNGARNPSVTDPIFYEIPFWAWLSPQYRAIRPGFAESARMNRDKSMQLDRGGIYALCDIAGIRYRNFPEEANIFSSSFRPQTLYFPGSAAPIPAEPSK